MDDEIYTFAGVAFDRVEKLSRELAAQSIQSSSLTRVVESLASARSLLNHILVNIGRANEDALKRAIELELAKP